MLWESGLFGYFISLNFEQCQIAAPNERDRNQNEVEMRDVRVRFGDSEMMASAAALSAKFKLVSPTLGTAFALPALRRLSVSIEAPMTDRRSYLESYISRLVPQTIYSYGQIYSMKRYIEMVYPDYSYESVIKQCLLIRHWSRIYWDARCWGVHTAMIKSVISEREAERMTKLFARIFKRRFRRWRN